MDMFVALKRIFIQCKKKVLHSLRKKLYHSNKCVNMYLKKMFSTHPKYVYLKKKNHFFAGKKFECVRKIFCMYAKNAQCV